MLARSVALGFVLSACSPTAATIEVQPNKLTLDTVGASQELSALAKDAQGKPVILPVEWQSSKPDVVEVKEGTVVAKKSGEATITAKIGQVTGTAVVSVAIPTTLEVEPKAAEIAAPGDRIPLAANVKDELGNPVKAAVTWTSSDPKIVAITDGMAVAAGPGKATVQASSGALKGEATITVKALAIDKIVIDPVKQTLPKAGATAQLKATALDAKGAPIQGATFEWATSDAKVVSVSPAGLITATKKGKALISVAVGDKKATSEIRVEK